MQKYEIMAIIENSMDSSAAENYAQESIVKRISKEFKGNITFEDFWGERGFAYKIKKQTWGYYFVAQFEMEATQIEDLRHELNLDTKIVRFMISKVDTNSPEPKKYADMKAEYEALEKDKAPDKTIIKENPHTKEKLTTVKKENSTDVDKDALDKKLSEIIDESTSTI